MCHKNTNTRGIEMLKVDELIVGCMAKAEDNEMTFVLLARDKSAPVAIRAWVKDRVEAGKNCYDSPKMIEALECAKTMEKQYLALVERKLETSLERIENLLDEIQSLRADVANMAHGENEDLQRIKKYMQGSEISDVKKTAAS
jgi:hypothetical protein